MTYPPPPNQRQQPPYVPGQQPYNPPPQYGPPPPGFDYQAPPRRRKKWPWIVGGIILVMIIGCVGLSVAGVFGAAKAVSDAGDNAAGKNAVAGKMGTPARDGKFEFTVMDLTCGQKTVGSGVFKSTAQGNYCLVSLKIRNVGQQAQTFDGSSQKAYAGTTQYSDDGSAEFNFNSGTPTWDEQINPGNQVSGTLVYDVPAGTKLTSIELHDGVFSNGVKVPLK